MKAILFLVLFTLSLVLAQPGGVPVASWAGSLQGVNTTWNVNSLTVQGPSCSNTPSSTPYPYVSFNYTFTTTAVRQIIALGDGSLSVYIYNGTVNTSNPCQNLIADLSNETPLLGGPSIEDFFSFNASSNYIFVVTTTGSVYNFALGIYAPVATGNLAGNPSWNPISNGYTAPYTCTATTGSTVPYVKYSWTQTSSGLFDITVGFALYLNASSDYWGSTSYIAVFNGNVTDAALTGASACSSNLIVAWGEYDRAAHEFGLNLTANHTYTVVASGSLSTNFANYGVFVFPSRVAPARTGFAQPYTNQFPCSPNPSYTNQTWTASSFIAGPTTYTVMINIPYSENNYIGYSNWTFVEDNYGFIYSGFNNGSSTAAPTTCTSGTFLGSWTSYLTNLTTVPGQTYSVVASDWYSTHDTANAFFVYVLTGTPVGNVNTSTGTTGGLTTGGAGATVGAATGTHGSTTNYTATTAAGSSVVCSFVFVALAILALLF